MAGTSLENLFIKIVKSYFLEECQNTEKLIAEYFEQIGENGDVDKDRERIVKTLSHKLTEQDVSLTYIGDEDDEIFKWLKKRKIRNGKSYRFINLILQYFAKKTAKMISLELKKYSAKKKLIICYEDFLDSYRQFLPIETKKINFKRCYFDDQLSFDEINRGILLSPIISVCKEYNGGKKPSYLFCPSCGRFIRYLEYVKDYLVGLNLTISIECMLPDRSATWVHNLENIRNMELNLTNYDIDSKKKLERLPRHFNMECNVILEFNL